jgi:signal transduction histidine kinase
LSVAASDRIHFRHKLEGLDADWVDAGARRTAYYTNLSPRDYTFRVEARSEDGTWQTSSAQWTFTVEPAIYQTRLFYAFCLFAVAASVWLVWNFRLQLMRRQFSLMLAERARLSREIHDTLLQSLVGVALQFDGIAAAIDPSSASAREQLVRVRRQVEAYIREARQSIHDLRSPVLERRDLATALREFAKNASADTGVRFTSIVSGTPSTPSPKVENQLLRIGQEAITNALRHAHAERVHLELTFGRNSISLLVSDNGCGFDSSHWFADSGSHYGLTTMRERAEELGGTLTVITAVGRGTSVEAVIPLASPAQNQLIATL